jgi:ribosomal protein L29
MIDGSGERLGDLPENSICLGTRPIELWNKHADEPIPAAAAGVVSAFECHEGESLMYLFVLVTDGSSTFQGRIDPEKAKIRPEHLHQHETNQELTDASKIKILSSFILKDTPDRITVSYIHEHDEEGTKSINLVIKEMLSIGVVKILWSGILKQIDASQGSLSFCSILGNCLNAAKDEIDALKKENDSMQTDLEGWKHTAERLDRNWQNDKDALTHQFFELYQKTHKELVKSNQEVKSLRKQVAEVRTSERPSSRPKAPVLPSVDLGEPDDVDFEQFDPEMLENLAAGKRTHTSFSKTSANAKKSLSVARGAMRTNLLTGAKEVYNLEDALLQHPESLGFASQGNGIAGAAPTKRNSPEGSSESPAKRSKHISL